MRQSIRTSMMALLALLMATMMVLSACSGGGSEGGSGNEPQTGTEKTDGKSAEQPSGERITLKVELFDRNNTPAGEPPITDNFMTKYIQENFGDPNNIDVEFVTVPRAEEVDKLNVLMASGSAPDIVFTYNKPTVQNYVKSGGLTDLGPIIEEHGPNLKKVLGPSLPYGVFEGKQYVIPALRVIQSQTTTFIRKDWLDQLGLPLPETTDQFVEAMRAFKEKDPGNTGGKVIPYGYIDVFHTMPLVNSFWKWDEIDDKELYAVPRWLQPGSKEGYRLLNTMYNEGLLDPDFAIADEFSQQFAQQVVTGIAGAATPNTNEPVYNGYYTNLKANNPDAVLEPIDPFSTPDGKHPKPIYEPIGAYLMVPASSKNAVAAVKYLNWMADPANILVLQNGQEGVSYEMSDDGLPVLLDTPEAQNLLYNYYDYCIILNGKYISTEDPNLNIAANAFDPDFKDFTVGSIQAGTNDGYTLPRVDIPVEAEIKYAKILEDFEKEMLAKIVTAKPDQFDKVYDEQVKEFLAMGGQAVMDGKMKAYDEFYKK
ncbi:extracellular solute-binding protein [Paenibacillus sp.]|uniref:extracellular solute-binding protein n=1 Tax=Paenibacillus sp. TaxID=58172 RepID=UPI002D73F995|nr:extracellular solute-binding protein [Paenibacillus sp.]HZG85401.1 extracellular solute-binding protein [Paenibacillus sp.]